MIMTAVDEDTVKMPVSAGSTAASPNWRRLVGKICTGDPVGMEELYGVFSRGVRFYLCRQLGPQELEDKVHDTFLIVVQAIRRGELREPDRLMGFVRTIVRRQVAAYIDNAVQTRKEQAGLECGLTICDGRSNPEQDAISRQRTEIMLGVLQKMSRRDREILTRFYLFSQPQEQICEEMDLSDTQFRLLKSRAKARFGELGRRSLRRHPFPVVLGMAAREAQ
jgi:RNA polymerase sigma-70 factor, ECF subfamily